jgi:hypothetical protein
MIALTLFFTSLALIVLLLLLKAVEAGFHTVYFARPRAFLDREVIVVSRKIEEMHVGERLERLGTGLVRRVQHDSAVFALFVTRLLERRLALLVSAMKGRRRIEKKKESSEFVRTIVEHKNGLRNGDQ